MDRLKQFFKDNSYVITLIGISILVYLPWIIGGKYITFGDSSVYLPETQRDLVANALSLYTSNTNFGAVQVMASYNPILLLYGLFSYVNIGYDYVLRFLLLWPFIILTPLFAYKLSLKILNNKKAAFIASIIIMFNTCTLMLVRGSLLILFAETLLIIFLYYTWRFLNEKHNVSTLLKLFLSGLLLTYYEFRIFYIALFVTSTYVIYKIFINKLSPDSRKKIVFTWICTLGLLGACNLFWLIPFKSSGFLYSNAIFNRGLFGNEFFDISSSLTLFHRFWTGSAVIPFVTQPIPFYFWLIPVFFASGLLLNSKRNKDLYFFSSIALLGVLLTKQVGAPFNGLYQWLYDNLPGFNAFREASKFYILTILGYAIVIGSIFTRKTKLHTSKLKKSLYGFGFVLICGLFLFNTVPFLNRQFGVLLIPKSIPVEYKELNDFLSKQAGAFRNYWLVNTSRWGSYSNARPALNGSQVIQDNWLSLFNDDSQQTQSTKPIRALSKPYSAKLFSMAGISFVTLPSRDVKSDDDFYQGLDRNVLERELSSKSWLKRVQLSNKSIAVYKTVNKAEPYFSTSDELTALNTFNNIDSKFNFMNNVLGADYIATSNPTDMYTHSVRSFYDDGKINFQQGSIDNVYARSDLAGYSYKADAGKLTLLQNATPQIKVGTSELIPSNPIKEINSVNLLPNQDYVLSQDSKFININKNENAVHNIGNADKSDLFAVSTDNLASGQNYRGLWRNTVLDCNNYDSKSSIGLTSRFDKSQNKYVSRLVAQKHTACTGPQDVSLEKGSSNLLISFDYSIAQGKEMGYRLAFNDSNKTTSDYYVPVSDSSWRTEMKVVKVPVGATSVRMLMLATPGENNPVKTIADYANARISTAIEGAKLLNLPPNTYTKYPVITMEGELSVISLANQPRNLITNPSFENGLWQKEVSDCHNYDKQPLISMSETDSDHTAGKRALMLKASRHIACTSPQKIKVAEGQNLKLTFDYKNKSQSGARYSLTFNDPNKTVLNKDLEYSQNWKTESSNVQVPQGANELSLTLYTTPNEIAQSSAEDLYDNFTLSQLPTSPNAIYAVNDAVYNFSKPKDTSYVSISPTLKKVKITGAKNNVFLIMSEAYDPQWQINITNNKTNNVGIKHISVNDFENGWLINVESLCNSYKSACTVDNDGSYNIELTARYGPQKTYEKGLFISIVVFGTSVTVYTYFILMNKRRQRA